ncbi:MAG: hypothetical protein IPJ04_10670 [Candidatus Eisenbacteria bacterium]|nr:hypothetical protein [Candidatus Eisenbacteria bacterium]
MTRFRPGAVVAAALICLCAAAFTAVEAHAAAEVHRLSLMLSGVPTGVNGGDFNDAIDYYNVTHLSPRQYESMPKVSFSWLFDSELRYFVRPNFAVTAGVGHLRAGHHQEFLPALSQAIDIRTELLTVPVHVGGSYYLKPYNQGDFQARGFIGGGYVQYTYTKTALVQTLSSPDSALSYVMTGSFRQAQSQDSPGYYLEGGAHMFFASRFSALLAVMYRSGQIRNMNVTENWSTASPGNPTQPFLKPTDTLDVGGVGFKMAVGIGF